MVLASVATVSYLTEVLTRQSRWAATILSTSQRALAAASPARAARAPASSWPPNPTTAAPARTP
ncbi:hypothetical protein [Actinomadura madurae]|nr:hypothetical protein [Actinomadura madurae]MCP9983494.1 hypothetical protein [Actinomadura madurae]